MSLSYFIIYIPFIMKKIHNFGLIPCCNQISIPPKVMKPLPLFNPVTLSKRNVKSVQVFWNIQLVDEGTGPPLFSFWALEIFLVDDLNCYGRETLEASLQYKSFETSLKKTGLKF